MLLSFRTGLNSFNISLVLSVVAEQVVKVIDKPIMIFSIVVYPTLKGDSIPALCASVTSSLASSVPNQSPIAALNHAPGLPPPPSPFARSNGRRRFTLSGAANSHRLPICQIHHRGILVTLTNYYIQIPILTFSYE